MELYDTFVFIVYHKRGLLFPLCHSHILAKQNKLLPWQKLFVKRDISRKQAHTDPKLTRGR